MTTNKITERIAALLRKAESTTNAHEAEAFSAKAEELMLKHSIEESMLPHDKQDDVVISKTIVFAGGYHTDETIAAFQIVRALGLSGWRLVDKFESGGRIKNGTKLYVAGYARDVDSAILLLTSLHLQMHSARKAWWSEFDDKDLLDRGSRTVANRSFIIKFGEAAAKRIKTARTAAVKEYESTHGDGCLVPVRNKYDQDLQRFLLQQGLRTGRASSRRMSAAGSSAGYAAGSRADTGSTRIHGGRQAISR